MRGLILPCPGVLRKQASHSAQLSWLSDRLKTPRSSRYTPFLRRSQHPKSHLLPYFVLYTFYRRCKTALRWSCNADVTLHLFNIRISCNPICLHFLLTLHATCDVRSRFKRLLAHLFLR